MSRRFKKMWILTIACTMCACQPREETVHIISTNDIHAAIDRIPRLATLVQTYRDKEDATTLLVDAGDRWTGNVYVDNSREAEKSFVDMLSLLQFDAMTLGHHDFDNGLYTLNQRIQEAKLPVILTNADTRLTVLEQPSPYKIIKTKKGNKISIIGLIETSYNGHPLGADDAYDGITFYYPLDYAKKYAFLKKQSEVFVALTHMGDDEDRMLAGQMPDLDLIIGGHTHRVVTDSVGSTRIIQSGKKLSHVGVTTIRLKNRKIQSVQSEQVDLSRYAPDEKFVALVDSIKHQSLLQETVGSFSQFADQSGLINLVTDCMREELKVDFAFYHISGIRVLSFVEGDISINDIFSLEPFQATAIITELRLDEIRKIILAKYNNEVYPREEQRADIFPSGMKYKIIVNDAGEAIDVQFSSTDKRLVSGYKYRIAMSDYMFYNYDLINGRQLRNSRPITDMLIDYFKTASPVTPDNTLRVEISK